MWAQDQGYCNQNNIFNNNKKTVKTTDETCHRY
jgi:hypothetical protein